MRQDRGRLLREPPDAVPSSIITLSNTQYSHKPTSTVNFIPHSSAADRDTMPCHTIILE